MLNEQSFGSRVFDWIIAGDFTTWLAKISAFVVAMWHITEKIQKRRDAKRDALGQERREDERNRQKEIDDERKNQTNTRLELQQYNAEVMQSLRTTIEELEMTINRRIADIDRLEKRCSALTEDREIALQKARHEKRGHDFTKEILRSSGFDMDLLKLPE